MTEIDAQYIFLYLNAYLFFRRSCYSTLCSSVQRLQILPKSQDQPLSEDKVCVLPVVHLYACFCSFCFNAILINIIVKFMYAYLHVMIYFGNVILRKMRSRMQ